MTEHQSKSVPVSTFGVTEDPWKDLLEGVEEGDIKLRTGVWEFPSPLTLQPHVRIIGTYPIRWWNLRARWCRYVKRAARRYSA